MVNEWKNLEMGRTIRVVREPIQQTGDDEENREKTECVDKAGGRIIKDVSDDTCDDGIILRAENSADVQRGQPNHLAQHSLRVSYA